MVEYYSIVDFCKAYPPSRAVLYCLWRDGLGPKKMVVGGRVYISRQAAEEWRKWTESPEGHEAMRKVQVKRLGRPALRRGQRAAARDDVAAPARAI